MTKKYITTAIPYVNGDPHIGHAIDYCLADTCARYYKLCGDEVKFEVGTDEHGGKIWQKAKDLETPVQVFVDEKAETYRKFMQKLGIEYTDFVRTTGKNHEQTVQEIWKKLSDHIYMASYEGWYCTGCERFVTDKEYEENSGVCPDHQKPYERLEEENYYFRIADFKEQIRAAIESEEMLVLPEHHRKEILKLLAESPDVSISRPKTQLKWGISVPGDDEHVIYVWIDALSNYLTAVGYPEEGFAEWWPPTAQFVGKDILRFHAIIWPAMLLGLGLELPRTIVSHGIVLADGQKMSKSIGNVVDPMEVIDKYGMDAFRYYFLRHVDTFNDSDFTWQKFEDAYNNELANDLGNLVQRLATLVAKNEVTMKDIKKEDLVLSSEYCDLMDKFEFSKAFDDVWEKVQGLNKRIDEEKPWSLAKEGKRKELESSLRGLVEGLLGAANELSPFIPNTSEKIFEVFKNPVEPPKTPLFPKK